MFEPEISFIINTRTGEVHAHDCPRVKVIASKNGWDPAKAALTPGVYADKICLPAGLPLRKAPEAVGGPTVAMVDTLLRQIEVDRPTAYWSEPPHNGTLAAAHVWLLSLRDHLDA